MKSLGKMADIFFARDSLKRGELNYREINKMVMFT